VANSFRHGGNKGRGGAALLAGTTFLGASKTQPVFDFMTQSFIQTQRWQE
jgi:hypothetical protein